MSLRRCTEADAGLSGDRAVAVLATLVVAAALGACATGGGKSAAHADAVLPEAQTLYEQAVAVMAAGDLLDAELRFKVFLQRYPGYPGAWVNLAIIHREQGDDQQALRHVEQALAIDPNHPAALNQQGLLLRKNGDFLAAEAAYLKAVTVSPEYALAHYNLGVLNELYLKRLDVALRHFEIYRSLVGEDRQVEKWLTDLKRRVAAGQRAEQVPD